MEGVFFLNAIDSTENEGQEKYVFKTRTPHIKEMDKFGLEMIGIVKEIKI